MGMVSMKVERESYAEPLNSQYGYGLCIYLTEDQVEKLGLKNLPPATGSQVGIRAVATVVNKSENADVDKDGDGVDVTLSLQITDMEVTPGASTDAVGALYG